MKSLLIIFVTLITTASCQIHTKLHADGYHYDRPQNRLNIPEALPSCLNGAEKEKCTNAPTPLISGEGSNTNSVKRNAPDTKFAPPQTPPPLPDFLPKINFPSVLPVKLTSDAPSTEKAQSFNPHEIPPLPDFIPKINLPKIIPIKPTAAPVTQKSLPVAPQTPPPLPAFIPKINLPSVIPVKPTEAPVTQKSLPVAPQTPPPLPAFIPKINLPSVIPVKPTNSPQVKRPIPPFPPIINLPSIIPIKTTQATTRVVPTTQAPIAPILEVSKPAPFTARVQANNEYLPPVEDQEDEWEEWKKKYNKRYASQEEDERRRAIFYENVNIINLHNADYAAGRVTFDMDKNKFCDLTQEEFVKIHTGIRGKRKSSHQGYNYPVPSGESFISREIGGHEGHVSFTSQDGSSKSSISYQASKDGSSISVQSSSSSLPVSPKSSSLPVSPKSSSLPVSPKEFTSVKI